MTLRRSWLETPGTTKFFFSSLALFFYLFIFFAVNPSVLAQRMVLPCLSGAEILHLSRYWISIVLVVIPFLLGVGQPLETAPTGCDNLRRSPRAGLVTP